ncbi:MAG: hypothetical protein ACFCBW_03505 [Candidatus Competibacterales bacterium]
MDFTPPAQGNIDTWLRRRGFEVTGSTDGRRWVLPTAAGGLVLEARGPTQGFLLRDDLTIRGATRLRLTWGVDRYPQGASYEAGVRNEALMVYLFFGEETYSSGSLFLPKSPYFIGAYLNPRDPPGRAYTGNHYRDIGRFVSVGNPAPGQRVTSEFDFVEAFADYFQGRPAPPITGIALGVDTTRAGGNGRARAFIQRLELLP